MRHIRPFDPATIPPDGGQTLIDEQEDLGCTITLRRGGSARAAQASPQERFALILEGAPALALDGEDKPAAVGDMMFIPAGVSGRFCGDAHAVWLEVHADLRAGGSSTTDDVAVIKVDHTKFEGDGFAYQAMIDRTSGSGTMRVNVLQVQPGSGSPDFHIHAFAQIYVIQEGEMTIDIGRSRQVAKANSLVILPQGLVHRNFNASAAVERHVSLLVPEPEEGAVFDYAITINEFEAELLTSIPA
ncbi:cupin domain-containing protein [Sphingobium sp. MK2]|uniref:cupin domain-containing protein n=1 Tax=Sphingobium sp. MK2 TaxID=3116540 RepID=UPI0032E35D34